MTEPEIFFSADEELVLFGLSCIAGGFIGIFYDFFRALRIIFPHNSVLTAIEDIVFFICYSFFLTAFSSVCARGVIRYYFVIGNILGFIVYFFTIGNVAVLTIRKFYGIITGVLRFIFKPISASFVCLCKKTMVKFVGISKVIEKMKKNSKYLLINHHDLLYNKTENIKRKNVKSVAEKNKEKEDKKTCKGKKRSV